MKKKSMAFTAALAFILAGTVSVSAGATETETCEHGIQVGSVTGQVVKIKDTDRAYDVGAENAALITGWGVDNHLRLCGDKLTNISFRTLPTYTVTPVTEKPTEATPEPPTIHITTEPPKPEPSENPQTEPLTEPPKINS